MSLIDYPKRQEDKNYGVAIGIVTNNKDPEDMGRVKIKFPWRENSDESYWARVSTLGAGKDRGAYFLPEVDDEVLVSFDHGDIHHPYVIGSLWNGKDRPPETNKDGKNNIRTIKSRSGHKIIFNDETRKEKLEIHTRSGHKIILDDSTSGPKIEVKDKRNNSILIDSMRDTISIQAKMIEVKAEGTLILRGGLVKIN
jgi:uncharacterized protein involved in type VI secretion and phage assembly